MPLHRLTRDGRAVWLSGGSRLDAPYHRNDVEEWFLSRGMPTVARSSSGFRNLLLRVAPVLFAYCVLFLAISLSDILMREFRPQEFRALSDADAAVSRWSISALIGGVILAIVAGIALNRFVRRYPLRVRHAIVLITIVPLAMLLLPYVDAALGLNGGSRWGEVIGHAILIGIALLLTKIGFGAVVVWSIRRALTQGMALTSLAARALPMILLVTLFSFFSEGLWRITGALSRDELWNVMIILLAIAGVFVWSVIHDEMRSMTDGSRCSVDEIMAQGFPPDQLMAETHATNQGITLTRRESANAMAILIIAQAIQLGFLVMLVFAFFCLFGSIAVPPAVVESWTGHQTTAGGLLGLRLPVNNELIQTSLFLAAFSAVNFAASSVNDPAYRKSFFDPLMHDMAVTVTARHLYRASSDATATTGALDEHHIAAPATTQSQ